MSHPKLTPDDLLRAATVYVRQSTPTQVTHHMEANAANMLWRIEPASLAFISTNHRHRRRSGAYRVRTSRSARIPTPRGRSLYRRGGGCILSGGFSLSPQEPRLAPSDRALRL